MENNCQRQNYQRLILSLFFSLLFLIVQPLFPNSDRVWGTSSEPYWIGWYSEPNVNTPPNNPWHAAPNAADWLAIHSPWGVNLVIHHELPATDTLGPYLDEAERKNIKVIVVARNQGISCHDCPKFDVLKAFINRYKDHPAVFGWEIADEPDFHEVDEHLLINAYNAIREVDQVHPVSLSLCPTCKDIPQQTKYYPALNIMLVSRYPLTTGSYSFTNMDKVTKVVEDYLVSANANGKKLIMVLQGFELPNRWRAPTKEELKYMLYTSVIRDTLGTLFYTDYLADDIPEHKILENVNSLIKEVSLMDRAIKNGRFNHPGVSRTDTKINYRFGANNDNFYYLIAVNESDSGRSVTFTLPNSIRSAQQAEVVNEGRTIPVNNKSFSDNFYAYQVHIYKFASATISPTPTPTSTPVPPSRTPTPSPTSPPPTPSLTSTPSSPTPTPTGQPILGDINGDGQVNMVDFDIFKTKYGTNDSNCDFNKNGFVEMGDYTILVNNYGR